jgi:large subunit ribosomal protein L31
MQAAIHPQFIEATVICSCGNTFKTKSLKPSISIDVCSKCHPYFTGEHKFIDTKGRVESFQKKQQIAQSMQKSGVGKSKKKGKSLENEPKSLKELLGDL